MARKRYAYQDVKDIVEEVGYKLLSIEEEIVNSKGFVLTSTKIKVKCPNPNHEAYNVEFNKFKGYNNQQGQRCKKCLVDSQRKSYDEVKNYIENEGYELLSEYINCLSHLTLKCPNGHIWNTTCFHSFKNQGTRCPYCNNTRGRTRDRKNIK